MPGATIQPRAVTIAAPLNHDFDAFSLNATGGVEAKQESLPPLRWLLQPDADRFAHPAEVELARLLTFYNVRWAYEPTTFAVRWDGDGRAEEFVTPDFFLPDHDCYLELTTMRQRLVTRKNRKFRLLRQHYPNVRVRILYLRDFERLQSVYGSAPPAPAFRIGPVLFNEHQVRSRVGELASHLVKGWQARSGAMGDDRPLLLGAGQGAERFLSSLSDGIRSQGVPVDLDRIELTSLTGATVASRARVSRPPVTSVAGRAVVVVQEVLSTGLSAAFLETWLRRNGAARVEVCALLDREAARVLEVPSACVGFTAPDLSLAGFGLSRWAEYRDLPYIAAVELAERAPG
jgi:hypoxanthine phosphoribosyltransferase